MTESMAWLSSSPTTSNLQLPSWDLPAPEPSLRWLTPPKTPFLPPPLSPPSTLKPYICVGSSSAPIYTWATLLLTSRSRKLHQWERGCVYTKKLHTRYHHHVGPSFHPASGPLVPRGYFQDKHSYTDVNRTAPGLPLPAVQRKMLWALYGNDPTQEESLFFSITSLTSPPPNLYFFSGLCILSSSFPLAVLISRS